MSSPSLRLSVLERDPRIGAGRVLKFEEAAGRAMTSRPAVDRGALRVALPVELDDARHDLREAPAAGDLVDHERLGANLGRRDVHVGPASRGAIANSTAGHVGDRGLEAL